jgi:Flp pilus assembly pilin Flp
MNSFLTQLWQDDSGQDLAEYALLLALIAVALVTGITALSAVITDRFEDAGDALTPPTPTA